MLKRLYKSLAMSLIIALAVGGFYPIPAYALSATGGTITTVGSETIHTFSSSGTFTVTGAGNVKVLVIGGGGGAACGGGAAGEHEYNASYSVTSGSYSVTVGLGGTGAVPDPGVNTAGRSSVFDAITALGGGKGGPVNANGGNGASGGGAGCGGGSNTAGTGSNGTNGGTNDTNSPFHAGGGGGSNTAGGNASAAVSGNGGDGTSNDITGTPVVRAAGGGGAPFLTGGTAGQGGDGGGGDGNISGPGEDAVDGTGSGGGGAHNGQIGGDGADGVVIISYSSSTTLPLRAIILVNIFDGLFKPEESILS